MIEFTLCLIDFVFKNLNIYLSYHKIELFTFSYCIHIYLSYICIMEEALKRIDEWIKSNNPTKPLNLSHLELTQLLDLPNCTYIIIN
jgi:hypothetical protein